MTLRSTTQARVKRDPKPIPARENRPYNADDLHGKRLDVLLFFCHRLKLRGGKPVAVGGDYEAAIENIEEAIIGRGLADQPCPSTPKGFYQQTWAYVFEKKVGRPLRSKQIALGIV